MRIDPTGWAVGFTGCFADWLITRRWRPILLGFLPLLAAASVGGLVAWGNYLDRNQLAQRYLELADSEVEAWENQWAPDSKSPTANKAIESSPSADPVPTKQEIPRFAETLFRRVQQLHPDDQRSVFYIAMTLAQRGSLHLAKTRLESLAPADREGYLPAHTQLAEMLLSGPIEAEQLPEAKNHSRWAMRWDRTSPQLLAKISELFLLVGEADTAVQALALAAQRDTKFNLPYARLTSQSPKFKLQFDQALPKAAAHFQQQVGDNPRDIGARLLLADVLLMKQDFAAAAELIVDGLKEQDDASLRHALSEIYRMQFVSSSKVTDKSWTGEIELLDRAFRVDPTNERVFEEVAKLARIGGTQPNDELMGHLRKLLADGKATSITHMWIAEHHLITGEMEKAVPHLEQAVQRDPRAARCWNNLAYCLAALYPDRLDEALSAADQAVALGKNVAEFHDTRGTVLVALHRDKDAVAQFEQAIELAAIAPQLNSASPGYHERISEAYARLGDQAMADEHLKLAREKRDLLQRQTKQP